MVFLTDNGFTNLTTQTLDNLGSETQEKTQLKSAYNETIIVYNCHSGVWKLVVQPQLLLVISMQTTELYISGESTPIFLQSNSWSKKHGGFLTNLTSFDAISIATAKGSNR